MNSKYFIQHPVATPTTSAGSSRPTSIESPMDTSMRMFYTADTASPEDLMAGLPGDFSGCFPWVAYPGSTLFALLSSRSAALKLLTGTPTLKNAKELQPHQMCRLSLLFHNKVASAGVSAA